MHTAVPLRGCPARLFWFRIIEHFQRLELNTKALVIAAIVIVGIAVLLFGPGGEKAPFRMPVAVGLEAPDITLLDMDGNIWRLSQQKGKVVFMNYWASWCKECRAEMPSIQALYDKKKDDPDFLMALIVYNEDPVKSARYMEENNFTMPVYADPDGQAAFTYGLTGVPETYIVDKKGIIRKRIIGPADYSEPDAVGFITKLTDESP